MHPMSLGETKMQTKMAILASDECYADAARRAAALLEVEVVMIDPTMVGQAATAAIVDAGCKYAAIHGFYDVKYGGVFVAGALIGHGIEVVLIGSSLGWAANYAKENFIAFSESSKVEPWSQELAELFREGRDARIQEEIELVKKEKEETIVRLRSLLSAASSSG